MTWHLLDEAQEQKARQAVSTWVAAPQQEPPVWAVEALTLETLVDTIGVQPVPHPPRARDWHNVAAAIRLCGQDVRELADSDPCELRRVVATTMTDWWRQDRMFASQSIPLDTLLASCTVGMPVPLRQGGPWPAVQVVGDSVLLRAGRGSDTPQAFRVGFCRAQEIVEVVTAERGVVQLTLDHVQTAQCQQADRLVIVVEDKRAVQMLVGRCVDQVAALWVFRYLSDQQRAKAKEGEQTQPDVREGAQEKERKRLVWELLFTRTVEHIVLPKLRRLPWVNSALYGAQREGVEKLTDVTQACIVAMLSCSFTYSNMRQAIAYFTNDTFGGVLLRALVSPAAVLPAGYSVAGVTPDAAQQHTLEIQQIEGRLQQADRIWKWVESRFKHPQIRLRAYFLSLWRDDRGLTEQDISDRLHKPVCGGLFELLAQEDYPPEVTKTEALKALQGMSDEAVRKFFSRYGERLLEIRPPRHPKAALWQWIVRRVGQNEAIGFWILAQLLEGSGKNGPAWETLVGIVQQLHKVGTQGQSGFDEDLDSVGCRPPDPRLCDGQRPPRISWGTVVRVWAHIPLERLTVKDLQHRYAETLRQLQQACHEASCT